MIYGRQITNVKMQKSLNSVTQELALSSKPVSTEFFLKRLPTFEFTSSRVLSIMANPAPIDKVLLEENPKVEQKVDHVVSDYDVKAVDAMKELYKSNIKISHLQKLLSVGMLGVKTQRKLVPTKWGITAVDDMISKDLLKKIKTYKEIDEIMVFSDDYNGNYYRILLLPGEFKFEVIEAEVPKLPFENIGFWKDYEGIFGRKKYASSVTGAYYANRLAICEYLEKIKRQATILVLREISEEYYAPLGVGILRELTRKAMNSEPKKFSCLQEALNYVGQTLKIPIEKFGEASIILSNYKKQKRLWDF
jgi:hypothetical protein